MKITLYELFQLCDIDNTDIGDDVYDWAVNFSCCVNKKDCTDYYSKLMRYFATQIECDHYDPKWYSNCFVSTFIKEHLDEFTKFFNEENNENYQPQKYSDFDDELFCDIYMTSFENLIVGNYSEEQYEKLLKMLKGE